MSKKFKFKDIVIEKKGFLRGPFGGDLKKEIFVNKSDSTYKVYEQGVVLNSDKNIGRYYISEQDYSSKLYKFAVDDKDFLVSCSGVNMGAIYQLKAPFERGIINQALLRIRLNNKLVADNFFYYLFKELISKRITSGSGDSTIPNFPALEIIKNIEIELPDIPIQEKIGNILAALDNKIEINNKINTELEQMAKTLYDYWFIQFDFPDANGKPYKSSGGKMVYNTVLKRDIPKGWELKNLSSFIGNDKSGDWGKENEEGNYVQKVECIRGADINGINGKGEIKAPTRFILEKNTHKILAPNDFVVEISGGSPVQSTGRIACVTDEVLERFNNPLICSNFCKAVSLKSSDEVFYFLYSWNRAYDNSILFSFEGKTSGIKNLLFDDFVTAYMVAKPTKLLFKEFNTKISLFEKKRQENLKQNQELTQLRDWLLPMLMNGQVKVADASEIINEHLDMVAESAVDSKKNESSNKQIDNYKKIQILYSTIWANNSIGAKQGEMATAKDVYLLDRVYGFNTGFQFAQHNWGSFDPKEKQLFNTKQYFHKPNFPNSKAFYLDVKDDGKLLDKIPTDIKDVIQTGIVEMNQKVFSKFFGPKKAEAKELYATIIKCIEDRQSLDLTVIRDEMQNWKIVQDKKEMTKAYKFSELETKEALAIIIDNRWYKNVLTVV